MNYAEDKTQYLSIAISCIDTKFKLKPVANLCIESKQSWCQLSKDIPAYEGIPKEILEG